MTSVFQMVLNCYTAIYAVLRISLATVSLQTAILPRCLVVLILPLVIGYQS